MKLQDYRCTNCGAMLRPPQSSDATLTCDYCGKVYAVTAARPEGALLLGADFGVANPPGWIAPLSEGVQFGGEDGPELLIRLEPGDDRVVVLASAGSFEDVDAAVTVRFPDESSDDEEFSIVVRGSMGSPYGSLGSGYSAETNCGRVFSLSVFDGGECVEPTMYYRTHPALRTEVGAPNRLRVVATGDLIRMYINDTLVTSLRDARLGAGQVLLTVLPSSGAKMAVSDLVVREPARDAQ